LKWLKHAFAIDSATVAEPNDEQRALVDRLCAEVARRRLTTPALLILEMSRPLNYVSAQFLHFLQPILTVVTDSHGYQQLTAFLEQRGSIEYICRQLEARDATRTPKEQHGKD
jgi:hypothetical protein